MLSVYYDERMVADAHSFSPSAAKPRAVVASWRRRFRGAFVLRVPEPATIDDIALAHDRRYVERVLARQQDNGFGNRLPEVAAALPYTVGAMVEAARAALRDGVAVAPVSGFHHAKYDEGGGYCTFNGLVVAAQLVKRERLAQRVGILDFDQHYGNGTTHIKNRLELDWLVHYSAAADFDAPAQAVRFLDAIPRLMRRYAECDLLLYQAGADPHINDPLGGWLTTAELRERDRRVFAECARLHLPIAWNLAGGYQTPLRRVLDIHDHTMLECLGAFSTDDTA